MHAMHAPPHHAGHPVTHAPLPCMPPHMLPCIAAPPVDKFLTHASVKYYLAPTSLQSVIINSFKMAWNKYMSSAQIFICRPHNQLTNQISMLCDRKDHCEHTVNATKLVCGNQMRLYLVMTIVECVIRNFK